MYCWKCGELEESEKHTQELCKKYQSNMRDSTYGKRFHYWKDLDTEELQEVADRLASFVQHIYFDADNDIACDVLQDCGILDEHGNIIR